jgi:hypothetical protein
MVAITQAQREQAYLFRLPMAAHHVMFSFPADFIGSVPRVLIQFDRTGDCGYLLLVVAASKPDVIYGYPKAIDNPILN